MKEGQQRRKFIRAFTVDAHIVPFLRPNLRLLKFRVYDTQSKAPLNELR